MPSSLILGCSRCPRLIDWRANPDVETTDWRARRGQTAHRVRREGTAIAVSYPYPIGLSGRSRIVGKGRPAPRRGCPLPKGRRDHSRPGLSPCKRADVRQYWLGGRIAAFVGKQFYCAAEASTVRTQLAALGVVCGSARAYPISV
jgi:ribosome modulation factor